MSITPNVIRVIAEGECTPATGLVLGVPDDACVMGCISALVRRVSAVGRTLGMHAEYNIVTTALGRQHKIEHKVENNI